MLLRDSPIVSSSLVSMTPSLSLEEAEQLARSKFGVEGKARRLKGERDENFILRCARDSFVLKVTNPAEDHLVTDFQTDALLHVAHADPSLTVPYLLQSVEGDYQTRWCREGEAPRIVRLMTFLPGIMGIEAERTRRLRCAIGDVLARLDRALGTIDRAAPDHDLSWDLKQAPRLRELLVYVEDRHRRSQCEKALARYESTAMPVETSLRTQVIHNDLSLYNVLVDTTDSAQITGVIDFGDLVRAPLVYDLAIASSYHFAAHGEPLDPILDIVGSYNSVLPITEEEAHLLYGLIETRLAMTILITEWRSKRYPENRAYILKNHAAAALGLRRLSEISPEHAQELIRRVCGMET